MADFASSVIVREGGRSSTPRHIVLPEIARRTGCPAFAWHDSVGLVPLRAHVFVGLTLLTVATVRAFRGHFTPEHHHGVEIPGIYWHFVDVMWIVVYTTVYIL